MVTTKTVFDTVKEMTEEEFGMILFRVYNAGYHDGAQTHIDRETFFWRVFPGMNADVLDIEWDNDDKVVEYLEEREEI